MCEVFRASVWGDMLLSAAHPCPVNRRRGPTQSL